MNKKEILAVTKGIISALGEDGCDLEAHLSVGFLKPLNDFYRGFCINPSQLSKDSFNVEVFFIPLFLPTKVLYFNLGWTLGGRSKTWTARSIDEIALALKKDALPVLRKIVTHESFLDAVKRYGATNDFYTLQAIAASAALSDNRKMLIAAYEEMKERLGQSAYPWQNELLDRVKLMNENFDKKATLFESFESWKRTTIESLKLEEFVS